MRIPLLLGTGVMILSTTIAAHSLEPKPELPEFQAWLTYFRAEDSLQTWKRTQGVLKQVSLFALQFDGKGVVVPATPWVTDTLYQLHVSTARPSFIWLTMVNDVQSPIRKILKDPYVVHDHIHKPDKRKSFIKQLIAKLGPADGLDIDFESLRREDGEAFSLFIEELAKELHAQKKQLSVTLEPKTTLLPGHAARAMNWQRIAQAADQVRIMAYFYHAPKGAPAPLAPLNWLSKLARFALEHIPPEKLVFILTVNGQDWPAEGRPKGIRFSEASALLAGSGEEIRRDTESQTPYFHYQKDQEKRLVWFEDRVSLQAKIQHLREEGIQKICFWQLGAGDPTFWDWITEEILQRDPV